ncbi:MAG: chemotaxis protein CheW [Myxococcota bacterium]
MELACLELDGQLYGIDVLHVREIVREQQITPLPRAPELIEGIIDLRGAIVPVVDLGRALGGGSGRGGERERIAILEVDGLCFGLRVQHAVDVLSLPADAVDAAPELATQAGYEAVHAVVRRETGPPVLVLSVEHLLESVVRSAGRRAEEAS